MILFFVFLLLGLFFAWLYIFGRERFSPANLMLALWLVAIAVSQLRLSPYERAWPLKFWLLLLLFFAVFYLTYKIVCKKFSSRLSAVKTQPAIAVKFPLVIFTVL